MNPNVNKFSIGVATVNGSGSQSSNSILMRSIFNMGIPVTGKNMFPSNISGLPTWFTIRVDADGYSARTPDNDILIAMNEVTVAEDIAILKPGAVAIVNEKLPLGARRSDITYILCPFGELASQISPDARLRKLLTNMTYVGVAAQLLGIDDAAIDLAISKQFAGKKKAVDLNKSACRAGSEWAAKHVGVPIPFKVQRMDKTAGKIIVDGNSASGMGAMFAGCTVMAWYPITPSSALPESFIHYCEKYRQDPVTGKNTFAIVQAEDEIAAVGMIIGAGWAGARSATSTSGPGISLMSEFVGLAWYAEVPCVIFDVQRVGPSTGLPTRTMQGDIMSAYYLSHGDTRHVCLLPATVGECFEFAQTCFDLSERFQTPVFVISDLDLGMNNWMSDAFPYPTKGIDRGKVLDAAQLQKLGKFHRYKDVDGDAIPYRTLPGTDHPAAGYFTRGSGHNESAAYSERADDFKNNLDRLRRKIDNAAHAVPQPILTGPGNRKVGLIAYGTSHWAIVEALDILAKQGIEVDYLRVRGLPMNGVVTDFVKSHEKVYVVEQNQIGQLVALLKTEIQGRTDHVTALCHYDGLPLHAGFVTESILAHEGKAPAAHKES